MDFAANYFVAQRKYCYKLWKYKKEKHEACNNDGFVKLIAWGAAMDAKY